jgi:hypothetical protein
VGLGGEDWDGVVEMWEGGVGCLEDGARASKIERLHSLCTR